MKRTYKISAEHVNGQSLAAMTNIGVVSDPTTTLPDSVQADTRHDAELAAMRFMQEYANEQGLLLTEKWWNSQVITVEVPTVYFVILHSDTDDLPVGIEHDYSDVDTVYGVECDCDGNVYMNRDSLAFGGSEECIHTVLLGEKDMNVEYEEYGND